MLVLKEVGQEDMRRIPWSRMFGVSVTGSLASKGGMCNCQNSVVEMGDPGIVSVYWAGSKEREILDVKG